MQLTDEELIERYIDAVRVFDLAFLRHSRFPTDMSAIVLGEAMVRMGEAREACEKVGIDVESLV